MNSNTMLKLKQKLKSNWINIIAGLAVFIILVTFLFIWKFTHLPQEAPVPKSARTTGIMTLEEQKEIMAKLPPQPTLSPKEQKSKLKTMATSTSGIMSPEEQAQIMYQLSK